MEPMGCKSSGVLAAGVVVSLAMVAYSLALIVGWVLGGVR